MILSFDSVDRPEHLESDVCIIGSGAAGITIAKEFLNSSFQVIVLSGGKRNPEPDAQKLYDSDVVGTPHKGVHDGRARIMGGTTTLWGGQALPFSSIDFEERPWVANSGWPVGRRDLDQYYERARGTMQLGRFGFDVDVLSLFGIDPPQYDPHVLCTSFSQWSIQPNFADAYHAQLAAAQNVRVLNSAHAVNVQTNSTASSVDYVDVKSLAGKCGRVNARYYIIACGAIENARLMLASNKVEEDGLGNSAGNVGRYFQDHVGMKCARITPTNRRRIQELYDHFYYGPGYKLMPKVVLSEDVQRQSRVLNAVGHIIFALNEGSAVNAVKMALRAIRSKQLPSSDLVKSIVKDIPDIVQLAYRYRVQRRSFSPSSGAIYLETHCEQEPIRESRIYLSNTTDSLGMPRAVVDWQITDLTLKTIRVLAESFKSEFERLGLGSLEFQDALGRDSLNWKRYIRDTNHHMGTTRMHNDPSLGVVDSDLRIHGVDNAFVASCSVFPTGSYANPTFTMLALSIRMADHLKLLLRDSS